MTLESRREAGGTSGAAEEAGDGLRVLHVVARLGLGGSERMAKTLAEGLASRGIRAAVIPVAGDNDPAMAAEVRRQLRANGIAVFRGSGRRSAKLAMLDASFWLPRAVAMFEPDVVHLHTEIPEFAWVIAGLTSRGLGRKPVVRTIHNSLLWGGWRRLGRFAEARLDGAVVAAVSAAAAEGFVAWRRSAGRPGWSPPVIYNGVPCDGSGPGAARPTDGAPVRLCFAGRFAREKGVDVLLDALEILEPSGLTFEVVILGAGKGEAAIHERVRRLKRSVHVGPPMPNLREQLASFDAIVMPSRFEGLPLLAIETICAGVALLAADAPGLREAIPPGYPGSFPSEDAPALARLIASFVGDPRPWHEAGPAGAAWARERFSPDRMVDDYLELYRGVVSSALPDRAR